MNRVKTRCTAIALVALASFASAGRAASPSAELREIELTDGSTLRAEIVSLREGVFHLRSPSLGEFEVPETRVKKIVIRPAPSAPAAAAPASDPAPQAAPDTHSELVQSLVQDPAFRDQAFSLQDDPAVQAILGDAATMDAIRAGDFAALANNPKVQELMRNPTVRALAARQGH